MVDANIFKSSSQAVIPMTSIGSEMNLGNESINGYSNFFRSYVTRRSSVTTLMRQSEDEAKSKIKFQYKQFWTALAIDTTHTFLGPISLPLLRFLFGRNLCENMGFGKRNYYILELVVWSWIVLCITFYVFYQEKFDEWPILMISTGSQIGLKTLTDTLKYGLYSEKFWNMMKAQRLKQEHLNKQYLLYSWIKIPKDTIQEEINKAFARQNKSQHELCVTLQDEITDFMLNKMVEYKAQSGLYFFHGHNLEEEKECYPIAPLVKMIVEKSVEESFSW